MRAPSGQPALAGENGTGMNSNRAALGVALVAALPGLLLKLTGTHYGTVADTAL